MQQTQEKSKTKEASSTITDMLAKTEQLPPFLSANNNNNVNNIQQTDLTDNRYL